MTKESLPSTSTAKSKVRALLSFSEHVPETNSPGQVTSLSQHSGEAQAASSSPHRFSSSVQLLTALKRQSVGKFKSSLTRNSATKTQAKSLQGKTTNEQASVDLVSPTWYDDLVEKEKYNHATHGPLGSFIGVVTESMESRKKKELNVPPLVLLPDGPFMARWKLVHFVAILYVAICTPFHIAFYNQLDITDLSRWIWIFAFDRLTDAVFMIDMFVTASLATLNDEGKLITDRKVLLHKYLRGPFLMDCLATFPWDILALIPGVNGSSAVRLPKLIRLLRIVKVFRQADGFYLIKRLEEKSSLKNGWIRLMKFGVMIFVVSHWMACICFFVSDISGSGTTENWIKYRGLDDEGVVVKYSYSFYWAVMTLTTVGYGDITARNPIEAVTMSYLMLVSAGIFAYIVGTMCSLIQGLDSGNLEFQNKMDDVNDYMSKVNLPKRMRQRIRHYMLYKKSAQLHGHQAIELLSHSIQTEVALYAYQETLASVPQFRGAPPEFLSEIAMKLQPVVFGPNEIVMSLGRTSNHMYIVTKGHLQVEKIQTDGLYVVDRILDAGSYFGETALYSVPLRHERCIRSLTYVEACELNKSDVLPIVSEYPRVERIFKMSMMSELIKRGSRNGRLARVVDQLRAKEQTEKEHEQASQLLKNDAAENLVEHAMDDSISLSNDGEGGSTAEVVVVDCLKKQMHDQNVVIAELIQKINRQEDYLKDIFALIQAQQSKQ